MSAQSPDWWQEVTTYLDQALELPEAERGAWLQRLRDENPALATQLQTLLHEHSALEEAGFLEGGAGLSFALRSLRTKPSMPTRCYRPPARAAWAACGWRNEATEDLSGK